MEAQKYTDEIRDLINQSAQGDIEAQYNLGKRYYHGDGVEQDYEQAVYWLQKAAEQGHVEAKAQLNASRETYKAEKKLLNMKRTEVFICYAHNDKKYFDELKEFLKPLGHLGIKIWHDKKKEYATIMWVPVSVSTVDSFVMKSKDGDEIRITDYQAVVDDLKKTLDSMNTYERNNVYKKFFDEIKQRFEE